MLFDLRGRGRRRTVQVIYLSLAVLMGGGLVLFGIGGATNGGLVDALTGSSGGVSQSETFEKQIASAERRLAISRKDERAWADLARARFANAQADGRVNQETGEFSAEGRAQLRQAARAWDAYIALEPKPIDVGIASIMVQAFGALNQLPKAVIAQEAIADQRGKDSPAPWLELAQYAYAAKQSRKAELAGQKAIDVASKDQKENVKSQVAQLKTAAAQAAVQDAQGAGGAAGGTTPLG